MKYVSFETAKKLKELGFDKKCLFSYQNDWGNHTIKLCTPIKLYGPTDGLKNSHLKEYGGAHWEYVSAPTLSDAMDWLRETYKLHIYAFHTELWCGTEWCYEVENMEEGWTYSKHYGMEYEQAIEEAIKYTLENFVKNEKEN